MDVKKFYDTYCEVEMGKQTRQGIKDDGGEGTDKNKNGPKFIKPIFQ